MDSFGYDTGQISGFLGGSYILCALGEKIDSLSTEMPDFLERFGQHKPDGEAYFSDVRSGLIVALVSRISSSLT